MVIVFNGLLKVRTTEAVGQVQHAISERGSRHEDIRLPERERQTFSIFKASSDRKKSSEHDFLCLSEIEFFGTLHRETERK